VRWKLSRTVLRGGTGGNTSPLLDKAEGRAKVPYLFRPHDDVVLGFAGIYDRWEGEDGHAIWSCAILTTEANEVVKPFHERMPVALSPDHFSTWLDDDTPVPQLKELLRPLSTDALDAIRLKPVVNSVKNEGPRCVEPAEPQTISLFA
jgi:putative SOS response-associated peptidase YedK